MARYLRCLLAAALFLALGTLSSCPRDSGPGELPTEMRPPTLTELLDNPDITEIPGAVKFYQRGDFDILLTYDSGNKIETCGCSPMQLGGVAPRVKLISEFQKRGAFLTLDAGGVGDGADSFNRLKLQVMLAAMHEARYDGCNIGLSEMQLPPADLVSLFREHGVPLYSANLLASNPAERLTGSEDFYYLSGNVEEIINLPAESLAEGLAPLAPAGFVTEVLGRRTAVIFLQLTQLTTEVEAAEGYVLLDPSEAVELCTSQVDPAPEMWLLVAEGYSDEIRKFLAGHPELQIVLTGDKHVREKENEPVLLDNGGIWFNTFFFGKYLGYLSLAERRGRLRYFAVNIPILSTYAPDEKVYKLIKEDFHARLKGVFRQQSFEYKAANIIPPEDCKDCHPQAYEVFANSAHAHSLRTLKAKSQEYNLDCLSCHIIYDYTQDLMYPMQCISCHQEITPIHGFNRQAGQPEELEPTAQATYEFCAQCHTPEQSTQFRERWREYMERIKHWN